MASINIFTGTLTSENDVYRRHILTSKVDPHAVRVNEIFTLSLAVLVYDFFSLTQITWCRLPSLDGPL